MSVPAVDGDDPQRPGERLHEATTARLSLRRPVSDDAAALHDRVYSDPRTWQLDPTLRSGTVVDTARSLQVQIERWRLHGLGSWVLREAGEHQTGDPIGMGGCSMLGSGLAWNLAFRLRSACWGRGFGQEVAVAAIAAAHQVRPELPVTAVAAEANTPSLRVLGRSGLTEIHRARDVRIPGSDSLVVLYGDRPLSRELAHHLLD